MEFSNVNQSLITPIFSPCSKYLATFTNHNINIKDTSYPDLKDHSKIVIKQKQKSSYPSIKFSPDSQLIAVKFTKKVEVYDIQGNIKCRIQEDNYEIQNMIWSQDPGSYQLLVFYKNSTCCHIYNLQKQSVSIIKSTKYTNQNGFTFSKGTHQGVFMAVLERVGVKDSIGIYFTRTWQLINYIHFQTAFDIGKIQFAQNGDLIAIERITSFKIFIADIYRGVIEQYGDKPYVLGFNIHKFSNTSQFLALGAYDNCIHLINTATWKLIIEMEIQSEIDLTKTAWLKQDSMGFSLASGSKGKIQKKQEKQNEVPPGISIIQFSPNDQYLAVKTDLMSNSVFIYSVNKLQLMVVITLMKNVKDFQWVESEDGELDLCIVDNSSSLLFWRSESSDESIHEIKIPNFINNEVKISQIQKGKNRNLIFYSTQNKKFIYSVC